MVSIISIQRLCRFEHTTVAQSCSCNRISIQRLCRFEWRTSSRWKWWLYISIQRLCRFELGDKHNILMQMADFNTTIVSVRAYMIFVLKLFRDISIQRLCRFERRYSTTSALLWRFQYNDCVGSRSFLIFFLINSIKFQYNDCVGSSLTFLQVHNTLV